MKNEGISLTVNGKGKKGEFNKEVAGELSDNPSLEAEGAGEKIAGKVQKKIGQVKNVLRK